MALSQAELREALRRRRERKPRVVYKGTPQYVDRRAAEYARDLKRIISEVEAPWLERFRALAERSSDVRTDALQGRAWRELLAALEAALQTALGSQRLSARIVRQAELIDQMTLQELTQMLGIPVPDTVLASARVRASDWIERNEALTRDLASTYVNGVRSVLTEAQPGVSFQTLLKAMQERGSVTRSRAEGIALNETLTLNGELNRTRQQDLGIQRYRWSSSQDQRVRDSHAELNGRIFSWADPPIGGGSGPGEIGHPGSGIFCRCLAIPVLD